MGQSPTSKPTTICNATEQNITVCISQYMSDNQEPYPNVILNTKECDTLTRKDNVYYR